MKHRAKDTLKFFLLIMLINLLAGGEIIAALVMFVINLGGQPVFLFFYA